MQIRNTITVLTKVYEMCFQIFAGFIRSGKVGERGSYSLRSEKIREACSVQGEDSIFILKVRQKISFLIITYVFIV